MKTLRGMDEVIEEYGWNGRLFFLTRDCPLEVTTVGYSYGDVDICEKGSLFHYANQCLAVSEPLEGIDRFGRNYLDKAFIRLCEKINYFICLFEPQKVFKSLIARKECDRYMIRLQYDAVDLEMEVVEMLNYFTEKLKQHNSATTS